jgi:hypothetical protein
VVSHKLTPGSHDGWALYDLTFAFGADINRKKRSNQIERVRQELSGHAGETSARELVESTCGLAFKEVVFVKFIKEEFEGGERRDSYHIDAISLEEAVHALVLPHVNEGAPH